MKKLLLTLVFACAALSAQAKVGWTLCQCVKQWGAPTSHFHSPGPEGGVPRETYVFSDGGEHYVWVLFLWDHDGGSVIDRVAKEGPSDGPNI